MARTYSADDGWDNNFGRRKSAELPPANVSLTPDEQVHFARIPDRVRATMTAGEITNRVRRATALAELRDKSHDDLSDTYDRLITAELAHPSKADARTKAASIRAYADALASTGGPAGAAQFYAEAASIEKAARR